MGTGDVKNQLEDLGLDGKEILKWIIRSGMESNGLDCCG
jgi:hypothetical protein